MNPGISIAGNGQHPPTSPAQQETGQQTGPRVQPQASAPKRIPIPAHDRMTVGSGVSGTESLSAPGLEPWLYIDELFLLKIQNWSAAGTGAWTHALGSLHHTLNPHELALVINGLARAPAPAVEAALAPITSAAMTDSRTPSEQP